MAIRSTWKGSIKLSLIAIPIRVYPATVASDVSFRQLHRKCRTPIQLKKWCPTCEEEVNSDDIVKGYESSKGNFVVVEDEEIAKLRPESTHVIDIGQIVDAASIDPIAIERAYYLAPETKAAGAAFAVLRDGFGSRAGVGRLALHGREYLVAVMPRDQALVMYTLRTAREMRKPTAIDELAFADVKVKPEEVKLARQVMQHFDTGADVSELTDHYQEALREMLAAKTPEEVVTIAGEKGAKKRGQVVDLMDALRQSLARVESTKAPRAPAKPSRQARARVLSHPTSKRRKAS
jgi:DNA end-binding protein Ku